MALVTSQVINKYYNDYQSTEVTFSKEIMHVLKMDPRQIYIKSGGLQWPCIINSTSFIQAKVILGTKSGAYKVISQKNPAPVSLRFSFYQADGQLMSFFVQAKVQLVQPYMNSSDLSIVTLFYTQRPPDDLISMIGTLLDANVNAVRRKEERIIINQESIRKLNLSRKEVKAAIQNVPRNCILQDLSFSGCRVVLLGLAQYLLNKEIQLQFEFEEPHEVINVTGTIVRANFIEGRKDIISASIQYAEGTVSIPYKIRINHYITTARKNELEGGAGENLPELAGEKAPEEKTAPAAAAAPAPAAEASAPAPEAPAPEAN